MGCDMKDGLSVDPALAALPLQASDAGLEHIYADLFDKGIFASIRIVILFYRF